MSTRRDHLPNDVCGPSRDCTAAVTTTGYPRIDALSHILAGCGACFFSDAERRPNCRGRRRRCVTMMLSPAGVLLIGVALAGLASASLYNEKVTRKVALSGNEVVHKVGLLVRNDGDAPVSLYRIALLEQQAGRMAECMLIVDDPKFVSFCSPVSASRGTHVVDVAFPKPLSPGASTKFRLQIVFIHQFKPYPKAIRQGELPFLKYYDSATWVSPYPSAVQKTTFRLGTTNIKSFSGATAVKDKGNINYGPFNNVAPHTVQPIDVHFMHDKSLATVLSLEKEIEVSHWGNVAIEEKYLIANKGPLLAGEYSRVDFDSYSVSKSGTFQWLTAHLPPHARDIYYRDSIGNVSTSRVRQMAKQVHFEAATRFPMFGGWKTDFYMGYNVPSQYALFNRRGDPTKFVLNIPFGTNFDDLVVDEMVVRVILPEGATDIHWDTPFFDVVETDRTVRRTYLDTVGRPMLELRKKNVVSGYHGKDFQVTYSFSRFSILREPLLLFFGFLMFFIASIAYSRVDLSLHPARAPKQPKKTSTMAGSSSPKHDKKSPKQLLSQFVDLCNSKAEDSALNGVMQQFLTSVAQAGEGQDRSVKDEMSNLWKLRRETKSGKFAAQVAAVQEKLAG